MDLNITLHALNELGVNELGFDEADLAYLSLLANAQGRPVGLNTIAASMREDEGTIEDVIEPFLLANGYLEAPLKAESPRLKPTHF